MFSRLAPLLLFVAACGPLLAPVPAPGVPDLPVSGEDSCGAAQYAGLVGQDASALERVLLMGPVRVIRPGMAVTMDYSPERINFAVDSANRISGITCG